MNNTITIGEVIGIVDALKPNVRTPEEKIMWLNNLDTMIMEDIVSTHEGSESIVFDGYTEDTPETQELLVPRHYGADIYRFFLEMQIDLANAEYNRYNASAAQFHGAYENYEKAYNRARMPKQPEIVQNNTSADWGSVNAI